MQIGIFIVRIIRDHMGRFGGMKLSTIWEVFGTSLSIELLNIKS